MAPSTPNRLHFVLIPLMAQGHMIPMVDMAKLLARRHATVTLFTTPFNASRFRRNLENSTTTRSLSIRLVEIPFPWREAGLPSGYESLDTLPSRNLLREFYNAIALWQEPLEQFLQIQDSTIPPPSCIISDKYLYWTSATAQKFKIPRIVFQGMCCFSLLSSHNIKLHASHLNVSSDSEPFAVPCMPQTITLTKAQLPGAFVRQSDFDDIREKVNKAAAEAIGEVINSFEAIEQGCAERYAVAIGRKVWCIGSVSLSDDTDYEKFHRGNTPVIEENQCLKWLDGMKPSSIVYVCFGSQCRLVPNQLREIALGLESSSQPFIWVVNSDEIQIWLEREKFEERIKDRGLLIKGWAPQVTILSHPSVGGFLTHCGWNSILEGICAGVPMLTWPLFAEQFLNERLVVEVLGAGISMGVKVPMRWGEEEKVGVMVGKERVKEGVRDLMKAEDRKKRVRVLASAASQAVQGGSSARNLARLISDVTSSLSDRA